MVCNGVLFVENLGVFTMLWECTQMTPKLPLETLAMCPLEMEYAYCYGVFYLFNVMALCTICTRI